MQPTLEQLKLHARRFSSEGVMECATHLSEEQQNELRRFIRRHNAEAREAARTERAGRLRR